MRHLLFVSSRAVKYVIVDYDLIVVDSLFYKLHHISLCEVFSKTTLLQLNPGEETKTLKGVVSLFEFY